MASHGETGKKSLTTFCLRALRCSGVAVSVQVNLYGFHVHPSMGALYHYYNPADEPANAQRDDGEWDLVRKLVEGGFVHFAEPCIVECHDGPVSPSSSTGAVRVVS